MSKLAIEANLLALLAYTGLQPVYEVETAADPAADTGQHGASHLPEVQAYFDSLKPNQRGNDFPQGDGPIYVINDESRERLERAGNQALANVHRENQNHVWAAMQDPRSFILAANYYPDQPGVPQEAWTRVITFPPGVRDEDVLPALKWRVESNAGANPDQKF